MRNCKVPLKIQEFSWEVKLMFATKSKVKFGTKIVQSYRKKNKSNKQMLKYWCKEVLQIHMKTE